MGRSPRILSELELNRTVLARQGLLERLPPGLPRVLERIAGIQAQYAPSMYIGLWSRVEGFERSALEQALERRSVVQGTSLRATIHLLSARDWWTFSRAVARQRREQWLRAHREGPTAAQIDAAARRVRTRLAQGPLTRRELSDLVGFGPQGVSAINVWLDLVRIPPSGTWERRRADLFADAESWIGPAQEQDPAAATADLIRSYLRGFGPSSVAEIADWGGLAIRAVREALDGIELRRFAAEDGTVLVDLPRLRIAGAETPAPARFLPTWDATLLAHARRSGILPERHRARVFNTRTPQSMPTFLVDGRVAGCWRWEGGRVRLEPFERLSGEARAQLDSEAGRLAELHASG